MKAIGWESRGLETGLAQSLNFLWRGNTYIQSRNKFCTKLHTILYTPNSVTTHSVMWNMNNLESWASGAQKVSWYNGTTVQWRKLTHANTVNVILNPWVYKVTLGCRSGNRLSVYTHWHMKTMGRARRATAHNTNKQTNPSNCAVTKVNKPTSDLSQGGNS